MYRGFVKSPSIPLFQRGRFPWIPLFGKKGFVPSLWQREVRRDFVNTVFILMTLLVIQNDISPLSKYSLYKLKHKELWFSLNENK
jgi:hypothetical protein